MKSSSFWLAIPLALVLAGPAAVAQTSTTETKPPKQVQTASLKPKPKTG